MPPGTVINNVEKQAGDRSKFAKTSGGFAQIIGHVEGKGTRVRLPSGQKKTISSRARASIGIIAGGGRIDKPLLKAGAPSTNTRPSATRGRRCAVSR